jgi:hypothetical protein
VRYLFRGLIRENGSPVEGHVEAPTEEDAYDTLSTNGVVTESLLPDPKPLNLNEELPASPEFADALESAFDSSSAQVDFDALAERYHGKKVWVIDRDKIRRRVAQVVDAALALSAQHGEHAGQARERVQSALTAMFADNRNLATERNAESVAGMRLGAGDSVAGFRLNTPSGPQMGASPVRPVTFTNVGAGTAPPQATAFAGGPGHPGLENQIARLERLVRQAEATLTAVAAAARRGGGDGGGPRRRALQGGPRGEEQNAVLLEIFKANLDLVRGMQEPSALGQPLPNEDGGALATAEAPAETAQSEGAAPAADASSDTESAPPPPPPLPEPMSNDSSSTPGAEEIPEHLGRG